MNSRKERPIIRVLIADDHPAIRKGLRTLLTSKASIEVVGEACDGLEALQLTQSIRPDVLLLDLEMPGMSGYEVTEQLLDCCSQTRIVIVSAHIDREMVSSMMEQGVQAYVSKDEAPRVLLETVIRAGNQPSLA